MFHAFYTDGAGRRADGVTLSAPLGAELGSAVLTLLTLILRPSGITGGREIPWRFEASRRARFLDALRQDAAKPDLAPGD